MTKVQNNLKPGNAAGILLLALGLHLSTAGQFLCAQAVSEQPNTKSRELHMLALGDSYTIGESVELKDRWPHQLVARFREAGVPARDPVYIARTGWTTSELLHGMSLRMEPGKPYDLVSILIGVNNQYRGLDLKVYEPELRSIVDQALVAAGGQSSRIIMLSIPDYAFTPFGKGDNKISEDIDRYNDIAAKVAKEYGFPFFNITPISRLGLENPDLVAADHLHPSGAQYGAWADYLMGTEWSSWLQDSADFREVRKIFYQQQEDWNRGDIEAFMQAYWKSDDLQFGGATGITRGWQNTLDRYKSGYPDRATMGRLNFRIKDMSRHSAHVISLTGSWELQREKDQPGGHFLLIWRRIDGEWKIVVDHTSQKLPL